jgi:folate-dependent phosphoribosylglycinamide formyltransferase PurN
MRPWITFFSQTGTEIHNLSNELGIYPDLIVTNKLDLKDINKGLLHTTQFREQKLNKTILTFLPSKPVTSNYIKILNNFKNPLITLHGYLRIIPKEICEQYEIYNLHPGLINKYPSLKGFNPQERAFTSGYKEAGCVIHKVTPGVDEGEIVATGEIGIEGLALAQVYTELHDCAFNVWKNFLTEYNINQSES